MEQRQQFTAASLEARMETLRRGILALLDGDLILPADGRALLEMLEAGLRSLQAGDTPTASLHVACFAARLQTALDAGGIGAGKRHPQIAALIAGLHGDGGTD